MDAVSYSLASKQAQRIEKFIENPDSTSGIVTVPKTIASGETVTVPAGRVAVLPNVVVDGTLNIDGEVFIPSGSSVDFSNGIKIDGNNIALSIPTSYHLLQGNLSATINANYVEVSSTTTRNYTTLDYIFDSLNNKLYDCILASTSGVLLTNTTYFTSITAGTLSINNAIIPLAHGVDSNGSKNSIVVANETITGVAYTEGKNYLYKTDTGYGVNPYKPRYLASELVRKFAGEQPDYYDVEQNKWFNCNAGIELVANGKFTDGTTTGWTLSGIGSISVDSGNLKLLSSGTANVYAYTTINTTNYIGKNLKLKVSYTRADVARPSLVKVGLSLGTTEYINSLLGLVIGEYEFNLTPNTNSTVISLQLDSNANGQYSKFDNISVYPTDIIPTTEITESRNYMNHIVHADNDGGVLYVEELPKIEYKDVIKANEFKGKNACTAYIVFDATTTVPTILDSYGILAIIRVGVGLFDIYIDMDNTSYDLKGSVASSYVGTGVATLIEDTVIPRTKNKVRVHSGYVNSTVNYTLLDFKYNSVNIFGGKN